MSPSESRRGVTSPIGVILMVALAVILVSVAGAYALGTIGELERDEPRAMFSLNAEGTTVAINHTGGDTIQGSRLYVMSASRGSLGNYAGTAGQSCQRTLTDSVESPPVAAFTASRRGKSSNVDLDVSAASDPDGTIVSYEWYVGGDAGGYGRRRRDGERNEDGQL